MCCWTISTIASAYGPAAILHDWLCAVGEPHKRKDADDLFRDAMRDLGVPTLRRNLMHRAVRAGGKAGYGHPREWSFCDPKRNGQPYNTIPLPDPPRPASAVVRTGATCGAFVVPATPADSPYV
jgi:hypothetical protein